MEITVKQEPSLRQYETVHIRNPQTDEMITDELVQQGLSQPSQFLAVLEGYVHLADDDGHEFIYKLGLYNPLLNIWSMTYRSGKRCDCCPEALQNKRKRDA